MNIGTAIAPLRSSPFRRYVAGQLLSVTCSWAQVVALSWVVVQIDPQALGWVVALQFLPSLLLGPWFGAVVDRHDRRRLLMLAEVGLGIVALAYATAAAAGALTLLWIYLLASAWGVINALDTPARRSLVPTLVPAERAASASALTGTVMLLGMTTGTAVGAAMVATAGVTAAFTVNAASFLVDVVLLATIRVAASPRVARAPRQIRDGIGYVLRTPTLREPLLALAIIATLAFTVQVSVPILAREAFDGGPALLGAFLTASTAGSLAGTVAFAARGTPGPRTLKRAVLGMGTGMLVTACAPHQMLAIAGLAGAGLALSYFLGTVVAILQTAEPSLMGRVMSLFAAVLLGGTTLGGPITTALTAAAGGRAPFVMGAAAALLALAVLTVARRSSTARR